MKKITIIIMLAILGLNVNAQWVMTSYTSTNRIRCATFDDTNIFVGTTHGIRFSPDQGLTWANRNVGLLSNSINAFAVNGINIYAGTNRGVHFSNNYGLSWTPTNTGITDSIIWALAVNGNMIYAASDTDGVYLSTNAGLTWTPTNPSIINYSLTSVALKGNQVFVGTGGFGIFTSIDSGATWFMVNTGFYPYTDIKTLAVKGANIYAGTDQGLFISSDNGMHWNQVYNGITSYSVNSIIFIGANILIGDDNGIFLSTNDGLSWTDISGGLTGRYIGELINNSTTIFAQVDTGQIWECPISSIPVIPNNTFSGKVFNDINNNGIRDAGENGIPYVIIKTKHDNWYFNTDSSGNFTAYSTSPHDTITIINPSSYATVSPINYSVNSNDTGKNFAVHFVPNIKDLSINVSSFSWALLPTYNDDIEITYQNNGTDTMNGNIKLGFDTTALNFLYCNPVQTGLNHDTLTWNFSNLAPLEVRNIDVMYYVYSPLPMNYSSNFTGIIYPIAGDTCPGNNSYVFTQWVNGAPLDPNYKQVIPSDGMTPSQVANGDSLIYTIHFQNVGTDTAFNVNIIDTLSRNVDVSTFKLLASGSPCTFIMRGAGIIDFRFNNIRLPDSTVNYYGSMGFVEYSVKPKPSLLVGDSINNRAYIYFDYNHAVVTNTAITVISETAHIPVNIAANNNVYIFPNPASDNITVIAKGVEQSLITICDLQGQALEQLTTNTEITNIDVSALAKGMYFVKIETEKGVAVKKFIKE